MCTYVRVCVCVIDTHVSLRVGRVPGRSAAASTAKVAVVKGLRSVTVTFPNFSNLHCIMSRIFVLLSL